MKIKELPLNDRPIERIQACGVSTLSNEELLCVILNTGTPEYSVETIARSVLKKLDQIQDLNFLTIQELMKIDGIGPAKATRIIAALELGKRVSRFRETLHKVKFESAETVYYYYRNLLGYKLQEEFHCIYLDVKKKIISEKLLFLGTLDFSMVHPREIFKEAYQLSASSIVCIHNHPTSSVEPSKQDIELTNQLVKIGNLLGIPIIDHVIIGNNNYYSFFEHHRIGG